MNLSSMFILKGSEEHYIVQFVGRDFNRINGDRIRSSVQI